MGRQRRPLVLDDDPPVPLTVKIPASLHRTLQRYCRYRGHDESKVPKAAVAAISACLIADAAFQRWCQEHPDPAAPAGAAPAGRAPRRRTREGGDRAPEA